MASENQNRICVECGVTYVTSGRSAKCGKCRNKKRVTEVTVTELPLSERLRLAIELIERYAPELFAD